MSNNNSNTVEQENNYKASQISVLKGLEAVYKRPGMYIGSTDEQGLMHCLIEIIDNSVDEHNAGFCSKITVELFEDDSVSVLDNGRGIPTGIHPEFGVSAATIAVTELHAGGKFGGENSSYNRTGGLHGVGSSVVNALSDWFEMTIYQNGKEYFQRFEKQIENKKVKPAIPVAELKEVGETDYRGTKIYFKLNKDVFSDKEYSEKEDKTVTTYYTFDEKVISEKLKLLAFLNPSLELVFINHRDKVVLNLNSDESNNANNDVSGEEKLNNNSNDIEIINNNYQTTEILADGSVKKTWLSDNVSQYIDLLSEDMGNKESPILGFEREVEEQKGSEKGQIFVRLAMEWFSGSETKINCFANNIYTPLGGTHETGLKKALNFSLKNYVSNNLIEKEQKEYEKVNSVDIVEGLACLLSIKVSEPKFQSQTKDKLLTKEVESAVYHSVKEYLERWFNENPKETKQIIERILRARKAREAADKAREISNKDKKNISFSVPVKLADCQSKDATMCEIFLVEGDSAGGSAKLARNKKFQAVMPLKGKILNTEKAETSKALASQEVNSLLAALGCGVGKHFDINKLRYHKIIMMTDADVDGQHIRVLLLTFFKKYLPELLKNGHIYTAITPLYRVKKKKGKNEHYYLKDDNELEEFKRNNNMSLWDVSRFKGLGEMNPEELEETTMSQKTRALGLIEYDDVLVDEINDTFDMLMGDDADRRKEFLSSYQ